MSFSDKLTTLVAKHKELGERLSSGALGGKEFVAVSKEYSALTPLVEKINEYRAAQGSFADLSAMAADPGDRDMQRMAEEEMHEVKKRIPELEQEIKVLLLPKDEADEKNAILEIRAGTGGDEAAIFAGDLLGMYQRYADRRGWKFELLEGSQAEMGGYKEVSAAITGRNVFQRLKYESGVHRVQRVPKTETQGRIHTSAATVAVLPEAEDVDIDINEKDLQVDTLRSSGAGGQHVNKTESAIRITHIPTGTVVYMQEERSQHKNRAKAMRVLKSRIYDNERAKLDAERAATRKGMIGSGDRSERIRTYNYPQSRVTDHRVNLTLYNLDTIMSTGDIDEIIDKLTAEDQAAKLAEAI